MPSPFPGMDPYIEASHLWEDFHNKFIGEVERALAAVLPDRYVVRAGERSYVVLSEPEGEAERSMQPDVRVFVSRSGRTKEKRSQRTATAEEVPWIQAPVSMLALVETEYREHFLEVREIQPQRKVVTCIEVLSPSNKHPGTPGWVQYLRKRQAYLQGYAHFVEIDLLRGGRRMPMHSDWPDSPYYLLVCRREEAPHCSVWPAHFMHPLPPLLIPLAKPDPDVSLPIQPLVEAVFTRSRYERDMNYRQPLPSPLSPSETAWLKKRLRQRRA